MATPQGRSLRVAARVTLRKVEFEQATIHLPALRHSPPHYDGLIMAAGPSSLAQVDTMKTVATG